LRPFPEGARAFGLEGKWKVEEESDMKVVRSRVKFLVVGLALIAVGAASIGVMASPERDETPSAGSLPASAALTLPGKLSWNVSPGSLRTYDMSATFCVEVELDPQAGQAALPTTAILKTQATVRARFHKRDHDALWVGYSLVDPQVEQVGAEQVVTLSGEDLRGYAGEALVHIGAQGEVLGIRFQREQARAFRSLMRGVVSWLHLPLPAAQALTWEATSQDPSGSFRARYQVLSVQGQRVTLERQKLEQLTLTLGVAAQAPEVSGTLRATLDRSRGLVERVEVSERMVAGRVAAFQRIDSSLNARLVLTSAGFEEGQSRPVPAAEFEALSSLKEPAPVHERQSDERVLPSVAELCEGARRAAPGSRSWYQAFTALGEKVRRGGAALAEARSAIADPGLSSEIRGLVLSALGAAGTPEAQALLGEAIEDVALGARLRVAALSSVVQVTRPTREFVATVRRVAEQDGQLLQDHTALLALGALATHTSAQGRGEESADLTGYLGTRLRQARSANEAAAAVAGLGNVHTALAVSRLRTLIEGRESSLRGSHPRPEAFDMRRAAVQALGGSPCPEARTLLVEVLRGTHAELRCDAAQALGQCVDPADERELVRAALRDPEARVRSAALRALSRGRAAYPRALDVLSQAGRSDPDVAVRQQAASAARG
jgi:HEAT repeat protein